MEESPSAECISSPTGDVESDAEGDNNPISLHVSSDPDPPLDSFRPKHRRKESIATLTRGAQFSETRKQGQILLTLWLHHLYQGVSQWTSQHWMTLA